MVSPARPRRRRTPGLWEDLLKNYLTDSFEITQGASTHLEEDLSKNFGKIGQAEQKLSQYSYMGGFFLLVLLLVFRTPQKLLDGSF